MTATVSTIAHQIQQQAEATPQAPALTTPGRSALSYQQLFTGIHQLVSQLNTLGISCEDRVAVALPNGPEMALAFLAIAAGATCAPLNPNYREPEYDFYLSDLGAKALIVQPGWADPARIVAQAQGIPILEIALPAAAAAGQFTLGDLTVTDAEPRWAKPDDVALILHTSGTTSRPKMVPLTHRNLCFSAHNIAQTLALSSGDRCLNVMPLFHIHGLVGCLLSSLMAGASVACTNGFQADQFLPWLKDCEPTWYSAVPTIHQAVLAQAQQHGLPEHTLRLIRSSSAALPARVMAEIETTFGVPVIEAYGMTEAAHQMTSNPLPPATRKPRSVGVAGETAVAIAATDANHLLPTGITGEVVIRGAAVTAGYVSNPAANATAFFDGWFRTGDQGYLDADGYLFLQGRLKEQVNRGGEKISPLEVDEALMEHPAVHQAVAFALPHPTLGEDLAAAVVLKPQAQVTPQDLRDYLFEHIANFKVPSQIIVVEAIPKGATGKLQRLGLADKLADRLATDFVAPRTEIEQAIASIFQTVLRCDRVGVTENFFVLGGDSLKGTQVVSRLMAHFGLNLTNTVLFRYPTVAELAQDITSQLPTPDAVVNELVAELAELDPEALAQLLATGER